MEKTLKKKICVLKDQVTKEITHIDAEVIWIREMMVGLSMGFSGRGSWALEHRLNCCGPRA